ncbi:SEL1-like repeat protein [Frisingicoccus sp.]
MYLFGCGCESDEDKAFLYYRRAAEMGIYEAKVMMWEAEKLYDE